MKTSRSALPGRAPAKRFSKRSVRRAKTPFQQTIRRFMSSRDANSRSRNWRPGSPNFSICSGEATLPGSRNTWRSSFLNTSLTTPHPRRNARLAPTKKWLAHPGWFRRSGPLNRANRAVIINEPPNTALEKAQIRVCAVEQAGDRIRAQRAIRVFMMDLLSIVPYYTGHLCAALKQVDELRVDLGSITYYLDRELFVRRNLRTDPDLLDLASRVPTCPAALRRALKAVECLINMAALLLRFSFTKPDVIHVQFLPMAAVGLPFELWFLRIARRFGIKVVYTVHNLLPHDTEDRQRGRDRRSCEFM